MRVGSGSDGGRDAPAYGSRPVPGDTRQTTLADCVGFAGKGLHTGRWGRVTIRPMRPDTGVVFRRVDLPPGSSDIPARWDCVYDNTACTALRNASGATVRTVEHLLAAL